MALDILIMESCQNGFWQCLEVVDIMQLIGLFISLVVALITLFAARAAMKSAKASEKSSEIAKKQLEQMNIQRIDYVKPEIILKSRKFKHIYIPEMGMGVFSNEKNDGNPELKKSGVFFELMNIGNGHSKVNNYKWFFNVNSVINKINELQKENQFLLDFIEGKQIVINNGGTIFLEEDLNYKLPILILSEEYTIPLPQSYIWSLSVLFYLLILEDSMHSKFDIIPDIALETTFLDILGTSYTKKFKISTSVYHKGGATADNEITAYELEILFNVEEVLL